MRRSRKARWPSRSFLTGHGPTLNHLALSTSGKDSTRPEPRGHSRSKVLLRRVVTSKSPATAQAWTRLPAFWVISPQIDAFPGVAGRLRAPRRTPARPWPADRRRPRSRPSGSTRRRHPWFARTDLRDGRREPREHRRRPDDREGGRRSSGAPSQCYTLRPPPSLIGSRRPNGGERTNVTRCIGRVADGRLFRGEHAVRLVGGNPPDPGHDHRCHLPGWKRGPPIGPQERSVPVPIATVAAGGDLWSGAPHCGRRIPVDGERSLGANGDPDGRRIPGLGSTPVERSPVAAEQRRGPSGRCPGLAGRGHALLRLRPVHSGVDAVGVVAGPGQCAFPRR